MSFVQIDNDILSNFIQNNKGLLVFLIQMQYNFDV